MTNFIEYQHPRVGDGTFTDKVQSAPETELAQPSPTAQRYAAAADAAREARTDLRDAAIPFISETLTAGYPGATLVVFETIEESDRQEVGAIYDADENALWTQADDFNDAIADANDALLDFGDWDTARHILERNGDNLQLNLAAEGPRTLETVNYESRRADQALALAHQRVYDLSAEGCRVAIAEHFPNAATLVLLDYNDEGSDVYLNPHQILDADRNVIWDSETDTAPAPDTFVDTLTDLTYGLNSNLDGVIVPGGRKHAEPTYELNLTGK